MRRITTISTTLIVFLGLLVACGNNDEGATNFFEENRNEWPELTVIEDQIGSDFEEVNVENDKGNSRVLLYENDGNAEYKSIYILDEERLKIISIGENGEGQIYNEVIR
ncbi:hypothetical protein [Geomicrobium sp. JCM 19038]|uniref:hypothetical protein n=1 Tax=Geomicrobium sp. JCM 19038 TaxID=1460635 RepID=UPI00045F4C65|nr:hypothetical protein [Geomicrobium sp. JCM 19038]GAK09143.1 hypothetical protein JCM19038_2964 [Geomicrobium sp. JCM 19038]